MIESHWKRMAGMHVDDDGTVGVVWIAHDEDHNTVHVYDSAIFRVEVRAVIAEGIAARGRHYPLAWRQKDKAFADDLLDAGINVIPEACVDNQAMAEVISREIWQKLRTGLFRVERRVGDWLKEYKRYDRNEAQVPTTGFPLMSATRHAIEMLPYAKPERVPGNKQANYPKLALI